MKRVSMFILLIFALLLIQASVMPVFISSSVRPDLLLILTVSCGLLFGREQAVGIGFFAGLLQDLASGNIFGTHTLSKMAIGYLAGLAEKKVFKEHIILPMAAMLIASVLNSGLILVLLAFFGYRFGLDTAVYGELLPALLFNLVFSVPVHQAVYRLAKRWN